MAYAFICTDPTKRKEEQNPLEEVSATHLSQERAMQPAVMMIKPPPNWDVHISILMPRSLVERIDDFRSEHRLPSRVEAIRQLIEAGLEAIGRRARP
jgi:hypothetical protein